MKLLWQQIPSTTISEILSSSSFDGVVLDLEHGVFSEEKIFQCIQIITLKNKKCFVRITGPNKTQIRHYLDAGVSGIIFSDVRNEEYAKKIIEECYYPTQGGKRGLGLVRSNLWGDEKLIKEKPILIAQIESLEGVKNLEVIKNFKFDFYLIGPYDLSSSLGIPGDFNNEKFKKCMEKIEENLNKVEMGFHLVKKIDEEYPQFKDYGFLAFSLDTLLIKEGLKKISDLFKE